MFLSDCSVSYGSNTRLTFLRGIYFDSQGDILIAWIVWTSMRWRRSDRWFWRTPYRYCTALSIVCREFNGSFKSMATAEGFLQSPLVVWVRRSLLWIRCFRAFHCLQTVLMKYRSRWAMIKKSLDRAIEELCFSNTLCPYCRLIILSREVRS